MTPTSDVKTPPAATPRTYRADTVYIGGLGLLTLAGIAGSGYVTPHQPHVGVLLWAMTGLYLLLFLTVASLRITVDTDGVTQRWLFSGNKAPWNQIKRLTRTRRGYAVQGADGRDVVLLSFLSKASQQAVADQTITRARLRPAKQEPKPPVLQAWERK